MIQLLFTGQPALFFLIVIALVISLSFHEFGHAATAWLFGDDTAQRMGRLTLNPLAHIDPMGLLMVVFVGFGWAKPVPTNPNNFTSRWADLWVSAAGPGMNLLLAFVAVNVYSFGAQQGWGFLQGQGAAIFFYYLATINLILMLFNLIPLGSLDGHYILPYFLSRRAAEAYRALNNQYGNMALMGLVLLSFVGLPVFRFIFGVGRALLPYLIVV
jgi:Zn-dependent protease